MVVGLNPEELPAPVRRGQPPADECRGDLARRVRPADVRVAVVDRDDLAPEDTLDLLSGAFGLGELGHAPRLRRSQSKMTTWRQMSTPTWPRRHWLQGP